MKRRSVSEGEDGENESKLSQISTKKGGREVTDIKNIALTMKVTWPWVLQRLEAKISPLQCELFAGKY
jgi:hypothetical protein